MPQAKLFVPLSKTRQYAQLVARIQGELNSLEILLKQKTVAAYWNIGKYISQHLLSNKNQAVYGEHLFKWLSDDTKIHKRNLERSVQFFRTYPIATARSQLTWTHYRTLVTVKDKNQRKQLEKLAVAKGWNVDHAPLLIDCGFQMRRCFPEGKKFSLKTGDYAKIVQRKKVFDVQKMTAAKKELFTYKAHVHRVIDGDTILALIDVGFHMFIRQRLRFRGMNTPEIKTPQGVRAKRFVQRRLNGLDFIVVKTYKHPDKFGRYPADIFYSPEEKDADIVAQEGMFLNQELLDKKYAKLV